MKHTLLWSCILGGMMVLGLGQGTLAVPGDSAPNTLTLWYQQPAKTAMREALPIGNGRMGALVFGGSAAERIAFNEISLWTGDENPTGDDHTMGDYQAFGDVHISLPGHETPSQYRRDLDLANALAHVSYQVGGVTYQREYFASHPDQALIVKLTADTPGSYSGTLNLTDMHQAQISIVGDTVTSVGSLPNGELYEAQLRVLHDGGTIKADSTTPGAIAFQNCSSITLVLATGTNYVMDYHKGWHGDNPHTRVTQQQQNASAKSYDMLKSAHLKDYQLLFNRVQLSLGQSLPDRLALPTDQRKALDTKGDDPELEQLFYQYGRYLLISCSRPGSLPANLQGLWNDSNSPPWHSDYHSNINIEMNYWLSEPSGLPECQVPFFDLIRSQLEPWRKATQASPEYTLASGQPVRGFAIRTSHNIYGGMGWNWDKTANAWYCQHLWEHYAFGGDKIYLKSVAYPILKETCEFWEDHLKALPDGTLVVPNGWSPEHGPHEDGVSYNQEIVWDLFNNTIEAAQVLNTDPEYRAKLVAMRDKLVVPKIGKWGQLQEWMTDRDDPNDHHRHTSHLFGVFPGRQFSVTKTPALAAAAKVSLKARGDTGDVREWSYAWRTALWARLNEPELAHSMVIALLSTKATSANLFGDHPPTQLDGNFGITAGITEMLLQSQAGEIDLIPSLPNAWANGSVTGLRARGGFNIDIRWHDGKLTAATIRSTTGTACKVRYGEKTLDLKLRPGASVKLDANLRKS